MALTKVRRDVLVGVLFVGGFLIAVGAMLVWDAPPRTPKHPVVVAAYHLGGTLGLFGMCLMALPVVSAAAAARQRAVPEPEPGPSPVRVRWHRIKLTRQLPDDVTFRTPPACPSCGDHELGWTVPIAYRERNSGAEMVLGAGLGIVGQLAARSLAQHDDVSVNACDPCFQLDASRRTSRVVLAGAWFSPSLIAVVSELFGGGQLGPTLAGVAVLGVAALLFHWFRFGGRRARPTALACGLGVRAKLATATWFALSERGVRWSLTVDACDPTWALALIAQNEDGCDVKANEAALQIHAAELRAAELR